MDSPLVESQLSQLGRATNDVNVGTTNPGVLFGAKVHLGQTNIPVDANVPYATLAGQEATYATYLAQALTWDVPSTAADNTVESVSTPLVFRPTDSVTPNAVYNVWLSNAGSTAWYYAGQIVGAPLPMASALDQIIVTIRFRPATGSICVTIA
jgi:hypothetical protein